MEISKSFASLVASNNGFFKSEVQASFLLSQCQDGNTYTTSGMVYNNSFTLMYHCDSQGVVSVEKYTNKTGLVTTWERHVEGAVNATEAAQQSKEVKRITRAIKGLKKQVEAMEASKADYEAQGMMELFNSAKAADLAAIAEWEAML